MTRILSTIPVLTPRGTSNGESNYAAVFECECGLDHGKPNGLNINKNDYSSTTQKTRHKHDRCV